MNPIATDAATEVFEEGGNAIDAAISAALTLAVVDGHNSGIGGGCLILIRTADGKLVAIDGRERAPGKASADMFMVDGVPNGEASQTGPLAAGVPGALAAYDKARSLHGTKPLSRLLEPGIAAATDGFVIDEHLGEVLRAKEAKLKLFEGTRQVYFKPNGRVVTTGDHFKQPQLAHTMQSVADHGIEWFYKGEYAEQVEKWMAANGGMLSAADFASYEAVSRPPVMSTYRDYKVVGFPPPSSGGVHVAQSLNMLEEYDLKAIEARSEVEKIHLVSEVFSRAFADRAYWLGDADHVNVPKGLIDKQYASELSETIDLDKAVAVPSHGTPPQWRQDLFGRHTTHITAADSDGNWVAITATVNTSFGSGVVIPGTGVVLNNEMDDFSIHPGEPNAFGLLGSENNAIAPGKRPLSSMSPTILLNQKDEPVMTIGAAGGPKIITQVVLGIIRFVDFQYPAEEILSEPRYHHQWRPNQLGVEDSMPRELVEELANRGHEIRTLPSGGVSQAIIKNGRGQLTAVADPRVPGKAAGK
ncbi:gamma-glutamyltransferase [Aeoliella mucimassa]|uniref:gamma-glutamyltransferase n=1 Tax=Aeoliella mucimassa TaxID=2527972 RepID=UPI0018D35876|nr:gamma-glutamyltransferase [Aeoliella mucimassa]